MYSLVPLAAIVGSFITGVRSTSQFSLPPASGPVGNYRDNPSYEVGDHLDVQWTSDLDSMDLTLWQEYPMANEDDGTFWFKKLQENSRSTSLIWDVSFDSFTTDVAKGEEAVFFLAVYLTGSDAYDASSHYFNVSVPDVVTSTTASVTSTAVAGGVTRDPTAVSQSATETATNDPGSDGDKDQNGDSKDDGGLSTGAVAGIAVGATLGGLLLLGAAGFFAWRHFRKTPGDASGQYNATSQAPPQTEEYYQGQTGYSPQTGFAAAGTNPHQEYYKPQGGFSPQPTETSAPSELQGTNYTHGQHPQTNVQSGPVYEAP